MVDPSFFRIFTSYSYTVSPFISKDWQVCNCQKLANQNNEMIMFWMMKLLWILVEILWVATAHSPLLMQPSSHPHIFVTTVITSSVSDILQQNLEKTVAVPEDSSTTPYPAPCSLLIFTLSIILSVDYGPFPQSLSKLYFEEACPCNCSLDWVNTGIKQRLLSYVKKFTWVH